MTKTIITCPHCQETFDIEDVLTRQLEREIREELQEKQEVIWEKLQAKEEALLKREEQLEERKAQENSLFMEKFRKEKKQLESQLKLKFKQDYDLQLHEKQKELQEVEAQMLALKQTELENARLKRTLSQQHKELELEFEKKLNVRIDRMESEIGRRERERAELALIEKEKKLQDQRRLIEELKQKSEQGSMQLQGEVQELAIEDWLVKQFPLDQVEEIKKGARGGDCMHIVNTRTYQGCGRIYYESKRTKGFQAGWIEKFKRDMRERNADIGVIVTKAMPRNMDRMGFMQGVWVCTYQEFKGLSAVLRQSLIKVHEVTLAQEYKGDKMELLYQYLTGNEFKLHIEAIVDGFTKMHEDLRREKNAMLRIWNQREKQIQRILDSTSGLYGSIKGIAGAAVPDIRLLELTDPDEEDL